MPIVLTRIDDRLIHGQVTIGWGKIYKPGIIAVVSDEISFSSWEKELCLTALPEYIEGIVTNKENAPETINKINSDKRASFILFESPKDAYETILKGAEIKEINVGGIHSRKGKREIIDYIFVDENDIKYIKALNEKGIKLDFRDLPESKNIDILSMI